MSTAIAEFKSMIKDQTSINKELKGKLVEQKDWIKLLKKLENVDIDLDNLSGVLDKVLNDQNFEVDSLFNVRSSAYTIGSWGVADVDILANKLNRNSNKMRNKLSEWAALKMGDECKFN
eukprot:CAMPEP_0116921308 /NCGR_PEP_ID=MMETSP0467-20121206/21550_1 /TAXON_ID=283647 /ORGANISM="Mesodinium pulex, Strain SPMC105" /LENGTH=118 /DNA_ID=CAMNT_0004599345 /DNA_START=520 /DNA_END=876 /DNA_ORIENTATION=-